MSGTPELTITVPCATCGGSGLVRFWGDETVAVIVQPIMTRDTHKCPTCNGTGVTRTPVTCAGCKHADTTDPWSEKHRVWCFEHDHEFDATFGCLSWTAKEATGNG